jgi:hypothetical protein
MALVTIVSAQEKALTIERDGESRDTARNDPFSFCAYGVSCRARAERVRYAGGPAIRPPGPCGSNGSPALRRRWRPETRLGFYVGREDYTTRATEMSRNRYQAAGRERVSEWLKDTSWPKPCRPSSTSIWWRRRGRAGRSDRVRRPPAPRASDRPRPGPAGCPVRAGRVGGGAVAQGLVLRIQAGLRWLEACAHFSNPAKER